MMRFFLFLLLFFCLAASAADAPQPRELYGLSLWGTLKYPENFTHFDYVNPNAPRGGMVKLSSVAAFDSLNPFIAKGNKAPGAAAPFESLMTGSLDEPQSFYGLVAKSAILAPDRSWVEFIMRPEAKFHDGSPITADDVVFSLNTLKKDGDPGYRILYEPMTVEKIDAHRVRFHFSDTSKRELPLLAAQVPIMSKAYYSKHDFTLTTLEPPLASGAYEITGVDPGHSITFSRVKNYWGERLPVNIGQNNFDSMRYEMFRDQSVELEAFKAGEFDFREENIAKVWANGYDSPALRDGRFKKERIENKVPQGMQGFAFNTRRSKFADRRVREAIALTLDFEWMNKALFYNAYKRDTSFFVNTPYAVEDSLPSPEEKALLEPYKDELPAGLLTEPFRLPKTDGSGNNRPQLIKADKLLTEAGWVIKDGIRVNAKTGEPLTLEFLFQNAVYEKVASPMRRCMKKLGIEATIRIIDDTQYVKRLETFDFDLIMLVVNRSIFYPGNEQMTWWHSSQAGEQGSNNYVGVKSKVIDMLLAKIESAKTEAELRPAARSLDRVLLWEHYLIPNWYLGAWRVAYWDKFGRPAVIPPYSLGFQAWWIKPR